MRKFKAFNISFTGIEATTKKFCYVTKAIEKTIAMVRLIRVKNRI